MKAICRFYQLIVDVVDGAIHYEVQPGLEIQEVSDRYHYYSVNLVDCECPVVIHPGVENGVLEGGRLFQGSLLSSCFRNGDHSLCLESSRIDDSVLAALVIDVVLPPGLCWTPREDTFGGGPGKLINMVDPGMPYYFTRPGSEGCCLYIPIEEACVVIVSGEGLACKLFRIFANPNGADGLQPTVTW